MCCILSGEPVQDPSGRLRSFQGPNLFQTNMMNAPYVDCPRSCLWCCGQFIPYTCGCTQYALRSKVLDGDMSKYECFQGYFNVCCCIKAGSCGEKSCPQLCLCCEAWVCNFAAVSASRQYVMEKYDLASDPCDYRLIRCNNCLQMLACFCSILSMVVDGFDQLAAIINWIADLVYHTVSGCMTAQTAYEYDYQQKNGGKQESFVQAEPYASGPATGTQYSGVPENRYKPEGQY